MTDVEQIAGSLSEAQRACLLAIYSGFKVGEAFRLDEGQHHAPFTALVRAGLLNKSRIGDWHTTYWLTELGHGVKAHLQSEVTS